MQPNLTQINSGASGGIFGGLEGTIAVKCNIEFEYLDVNGVEEIVAISIDNGDFQPFYHGSVITIQENSGGQIIGYTLDGVEHTVTPGGGTGTVDKLTDIGNVSITSAEAGQVVTWSGTQWINKSVGEGSVAKLGEIGNVTISSDIANGQTISWNGTNWVNSDSSSGTLAGLSDVSLGSQSAFPLSADDVLIVSNDGAGNKVWKNIPRYAFLHEFPTPADLNGYIPTGSGAYSGSVTGYQEYISYKWNDAVLNQVIDVYKLISNDPTTYPPTVVGSLSEETT